MTSTDLLRVTHIRVEQLFGKYTHEVPLRTSDRVTIIHGPNGVGKTVLLHLVNAVLSGNLPEVIQIPFEVLEVTLSDGAVIGVAKMPADVTQVKGRGFSGKCYLRRPSEADLELEIKTDEVDFRKWAARLENELPWVARIGRDDYVDRRSDEILSSLELLKRYSDVLMKRTRKAGIFSVPDWMTEIQKKVGVHLIEAQRLLRFPRGFRRGEIWKETENQAAYVPTVNTYARDLQSRISDTLTTYAKESQALDQSFPQRLLSAVQLLSADELKVRMKGLETKRNQLKSIGLIDEESTSPFDLAKLESIDDAKRGVMTLYVEDTERKLGALDDLARRIEILLANINNKYRHKTIFIDRAKGLEARTEEGKILDLEALSSGEQHELVLHYDLLFRVKPNTLVLIDEPELSLHVNWQKGFLPDLLRIVATAGYDVVVATHSPFIVGDRHDLMVPLSPNDDEAVSESL